MSTVTIPDPAAGAGTGRRENAADRAPAAPVHTTPRRKRRPIGVVVFVVYLVLLSEAGCRIYWWTARGVPPLRSDLVHTAYFPEMSRSAVLAAPLTRDDETFDVLLLGASVLHRKWGGIDALVQDEMRRFTAKPVRVYNLSEPGHTTRDSLLKYRALDGKAFDLVIVYHGMNDVRQNNCPREKFRADYSHCGWYRKLALLDSHPERGWLVLPYTLHCALVGLGESPAVGRYLPRDTPPGGWGTDGLDVKTSGPFGDNLREIATIAETRGDPLVLMTFAHRAERYLPFSHLVTGVNAWGTAEGVVAGMAAHNAAVEMVAAEHPAAVFVDQAAGIPRTDHCFTDPCHLTNEGRRLWVSNLSLALSRRE